MNYFGHQKRKGRQIMKNNKKIVYDERTAVVNKSALTVCGIIAFVYCIVKIVYSLFCGKSAVSETVLLFILLFAATKVQDKNELYSLPIIYGKVLDPSPAAKVQRIGWYILNSLPLAVILPIADVLLKISGDPPKIINLIIDFLLMFTISFLSDLIFNEITIKKYNGLNAKLDEDENDLSD